MFDVMTTKRQHGRHKYENVSTGTKE